MNTKIKETIQYEDFSKLDIRIGTVVKCENVPKSEKLLKLIVNFGELGEKQILTGMAKWYSPKDFENKQFPFILNLEPRKMMGLESQGMILGIGLDNAKKPVFLHPSEDVDSGDGIC